MIGGIDCLEDYYAEAPFVDDDTFRNHRPENTDSPLCLSDWLAARSQANNLRTTSSYPHSEPDDKVL